MPQQRQNSRTSGTPREVSCAPGSFNQKHDGVHQVRPWHRCITNTGSWCFILPQDTSGPCRDCCRNGWVESNPSLPPQIHCKAIVPTASEGIPYRNVCLKPAETKKRTLCRNQNHTEPCCLLCLHRFTMFGFG